MTGIEGSRVSEHTRSAKKYRVIQYKRAKIKHDIGDASLNNLR